MATAKKVARKVAPKFSFEVYADKKKEHRWRLKAANHKIVADSGEGYTRRSDCTRAIVRFQRQVATAPIT